MRETLSWIAEKIGPEYARSAEMDARRAGLGPILDDLPFPKANGCICDVCAERGTECRGVAFSEYDDYCARCLRHASQ